MRLACNTLIIQKIGWDRRTVSRSRSRRHSARLEKVQPSTVNQLLGTWEGKAATISSHWLEPDIADCQLVLGAAELEGPRLLPDGGFCRLPERVSHREAFVLEGGADGRSGSSQQKAPCQEGAWSFAEAR
jgi:hypothetical protein